MQVSLDFGLEKEVIIVNDGSTDATQQKIESFAASHSQFPLKFIQHFQNQGKGSCIKTALKETSGEIIVIQDADMEYDPIDFNRMLQPIMDGHADVVLGSRFRGSDPHRGPFLFHRWGNKFFTGLINLLTKQTFTDIHTCYKMIKMETMKEISINERRFACDPEMVVKFAKKKNIKIFEVGISYYGRSYSEGKKINLKDAFRALFCIIKYYYQKQN